jgi:serine/threonine protein kinase
VNRNMEFKLEKNENINTTQAGSGFFMSPEMMNNNPNGIKTDSWSFGVTLGCMAGLDDICPPGYKGGVPGFMKNCANSKHDLDMHKEGIYLSPIFKDLMKNLLMVNQKTRFSMDQVLDHQFMLLNPDEYTKGYDKWELKAIPKLQAKQQKREE